MRDGGSKLLSHVGVGENKVKGCLHDSVRMFVNMEENKMICWSGTYPKGPALRTSLSRSKPSINTRTPRFTSPNRFSRGTNTSSKISSPVFEPRMPSLSSLRAHEKPLEDFSTTKAVIPFEPFSGSVLAYTTIKSASGPYHALY